MKTSRRQTFIALAAMIFAILALTHVFFDVYGLLHLELPWVVAQGGARIIVACLLSWGLTTLLFHFES